MLMHKTSLQMMTMQEKFKLELLGSLQLIAGIILVLLWLSTPQNGGQQLLDSSLSSS